MSYNDYFFPEGIYSSLMGLESLDMSNGFVNSNFTSAMWAGLSMLQNLYVWAGYRGLHGVVFTLVAALCTCNMHVRLPLQKMRIL